jgi:hypothetical protein
LRLNRRIPPGIQQVNIFGGSEIQPLAAGLQTDQEKLAPRVALKSLDRHAAIASPAIEIFIIDALTLEAMSNNRQEAGELRKDEGFMSLRDVA